jgi:hypothetical protein
MDSGHHRPREQQRSQKSRHPSPISTEAPKPNVKLSGMESSVAARVFTPESDNLRSVKVNRIAWFEDVRELWRSVEFADQITLACGLAVGAQTELPGLGRESCGRMQGLQWAA